MYIRCRTEFNFDQSLESKVHVSLFFFFFKFSSCLMWVYSVFSSVLQPDYSHPFSVRFRLGHIWQPITEQQDASKAETVNLLPKVLVRSVVVENRLCDWWNSHLHLDLLANTFKIFLKMYFRFLYCHPASVLHLFIVLFNKETICEKQ